MPHWRWPTWLVLANIAFWLGLGLLLLVTPDPVIDAGHLFVPVLAKAGAWTGGFALAVVASLIIWSEARPASNAGPVRAAVAFIVLVASGLSVWMAAVLLVRLAEASS